MPSRTVLALEPIACPLCKENRHRIWGKENGFDAVKCANCGLVFVNPRPGVAEITEANKIGEHRTADGTLNVVYQRSAERISHYARIVEHLFADEIRGAPFAWLDIGAGYGEFVEALMKTLPSGSRIQGIEPMHGKVAEALRLNLPISTEPLARVEGRFEAVSMINVFSHLPDFDAFLADIRRIMTNRAVLLLETGNGGDLDDSSQYPDVLCLPDHLVFAGAKHIAAFLERNGFEVLSVHQRRLDTLRWMAYNVAGRLRGRAVKLGLPYSSPFRTMFVKARLK